MSERPSDEAFLDDSGTPGTLEENNGETFGAVGVEPTLSAVRTARPCLVPVGELQAADSPRTGGEIEGHVHHLASLPPDRLPPIVVHRESRQVVDGMHRLRAALLRGDRATRAVLVEGTLGEAFLLGVELNAAHGMPLSRADRTAAVLRILASHPDHSDRVVADIAGVSARTVGALRAQAGHAGGTTRTGRDGRRRPVDPAQGRRRVEQVLAAQPDASLRQVAKAAGVAVETARRVRMELQGRRPVVGRPSAGTGEPPRAAAPSGAADGPRRDDRTTLGVLMRDPSVRSSESGRRLLRLLDMESGGSERWESLVDGLPPHCSTMVADLAERRARAWSDVARQLRTPGRAVTVPGATAATPATPATPMT